MMLLSKITVIDSPLWHSPAMGSWSGLQYPAGIPSCVAGLCLIKRLLVSPRTFLTLLFQHKFLAKQVIIKVCRSHGWVVHTVDVPTPLKACKAPCGVMKANKESLTLVPASLLYPLSSSVCFISMALPSSSDGPKAMAIACIVLGVSKTILTKNLSRHSIPSAEIFVE